VEEVKVGWIVKEKVDEITDCMVVKLSGESA